MKGIILAGGIGTRLWPITEGVSKQLLNVHDKPMIYYPLSTLMLAGIRDIAMITTAQDQPSFKRLLGTGSTLGISIKYFIQDKPNGIAEAFILCQDFIETSPVALILGDNIFHGQGVGRNLQNFSNPTGAQIFAYQVYNPQDFGVVVLNDDSMPVDIIEKPTNNQSNLAVPGLYFYNAEVTRIAKLVKRSKRGELEITSLNLMYLEKKSLEVSVLSRGTAWFDGGTVKALHEATSYIKSIEERQGQKVGCIEEISWRNKWITDKDLKTKAEKYQNNEYGLYLKSLLNDYSS
jgi:glucose-1-phosphate thymidylyltransferase